MSFTSLNFYAVYNSINCINALMLTFTCTMIVILIIKCHMQISRFKVQGFFICHMINYTGYNQKWNVGQIRSAQWTVQRIKINKKKYIYKSNTTQEHIYIYIYI